MVTSALSFNVLYDGLEDVAVPWSDRLDDVARLIRFHDPTLVGLQECWRGQADDVRAALPEYEWFGENREVGEHTPIGVHRERATIGASETFWLAPDQTDPGPAWDATLPRLATHVTVTAENTGESAEHYNVHLDVDGREARVESARLLRNRVSEHETPVILTGDCNCLPSSKPHELLADELVDARESVADPHGPRETYHGYDREKSKRIDYVFLDPSLAVEAYGVLTDLAANWRSPSDHWPILTRFA